MIDYKSMSLRQLENEKAVLEEKIRQMREEADRIQKIMIEKFTVGYRVVLPNDDGEVLSEIPSIEEAKRIAKEWVRSVYGGGYDKDIEDYGSASVDMGSYGELITVIEIEPVLKDMGE